MKGIKAICKVALIGALGLLNPSLGSAQQYEIPPPPAPGAVADVPSMQELLPTLMTTIRVQLLYTLARHGSQIPFFYARGKGAFKRGGVTLTMRRMKNDAAIIRQVLRKPNSLGVVDLVSAMNARAEGKPITALMNLYGHVVVVNDELLGPQRETLRDFVAVSQQAFADCVRTSKPCIKTYSRVRRYKRLATDLAWRDAMNRMGNGMMNTGVGYFHPDWIRSEYKKQVAEDVVVPFEITRLYTNSFIDPNLRLSESRALLSSYYNAVLR